MKENPLISVIVPCYQVEQYLPKCIESILRQTYRHLEIILVDDGSLDGSGDICDAYAKEDNRIIVIHKSNGGLSDARNVAIDQAKGEWITFVDSDDYISDNYVECLFSLAEMYGCDCSVCRFLSFHEGEIIKSPPIPLKSEFYSPMEAVEYMFYQERFDNNAHSKLYHKRLFEDGIRYPKDLVFEDLATTYKLILKSNGVAYTNKQLYYYLLRDGSIERQYTEKKVCDALSILKIMDKDLSSYPELSNAYLCRKFSFIMHILMGIPKNDGHYNEMVCTLKEIRKQVLLDCNARRKARIAVILSYLGMDVVKFCFTVVNKR